MNAALCLTLWKKKPKNEPTRLCKGGINVEVTLQNFGTLSNTVSKGQCCRHCIGSLVRDGTRADLIFILIHHRVMLKNISTLPSDHDGLAYCTNSTGSLQLASGATKLFHFFDFTTWKQHESSIITPPELKVQYRTSPTQSAPFYGI